MLQRWEYLMLEAHTNYGGQRYMVNGEQHNQLKNQSMAQVLNQIGAQGYEMITFSQTEPNVQLFVFKRPRVGTQPIQALTGNDPSKQGG